MDRQFTKINSPFICIQCDREVLPLKNGSCRNHCPFCLFSLHVDINPGDRQNPCKSPLRPIAYENSGKKGVVVVFQCEGCGAITKNKAALDDPEQGDDYDLILSLGSKY